MYKHIDFTQLEGLPFTQDQLKFMQESYRDAFAGIAAFLGTNVIVTGVDDLGASYGAGWVAINGELLPFIAGTKAAQIIIEETTTNETFEDGISRTVSFQRVAKCGVSGGVNVSSFTRLSTIKQLTDVVSGAPGALDTLLELANALGNDANFSTSVLTLIGAKVAKAGDTMTGNLSIPNATLAAHAVNKGQADTAYSRHNPIAINPGNDANNFLSGSIQFAQSADVNTPSADEYIIITSGAGTLLRQMAIQVSGSGLGRLFVRSKNISGVWSGWTVNNV